MSSSSSSNNNTAKLIRVLHPTKGNKLIAYNSDYPDFVQKVRTKYEIDTSSQIQFQDSSEDEVDEDVFDQFILKSETNEEKKPTINLIINDRKQIEPPHSDSIHVHNVCLNPRITPESTTTAATTTSSVPTAATALPPESNVPLEPPPPYSPGLFVHSPAPAPASAPPFSSALPNYQERQMPYQHWQQQQQPHPQLHQQVFTVQPGPSRLQTVVVSTPSIGDPARVRCPYCATYMTTRVTYQENCTTCFCAAFLCAVGLWPCSFIPFFLDDCKEPHHECSVCRREIRVLHN